MAVPTLIKTYTITANTTVLSQGLLYLNKMLVWKAIKDAMVSGGWTVISSSSGRIDTGSVNAGTQSNSDNWNSATDFSGTDHLGIPSAARFPWIVLQNSALGGGTYQLLISNNNLNANGNMLIRVSPSVGFTGGGIGTNPTAADSFDAITSTTAHSGLDTTHKVHVWVSTDKEVTQAAVYRAQRTGESATNLCIFFRIEKPQDVVSGWTNPSISTFQCCVAAGGAGFASYANLTNPVNRGRTAGTIAIGWTGETDRSGSQLLAEITDIGSLPNDLTLEWPFFGIGFQSKTVGSKGRHGSAYDIWWRPVGLQEGHTLPNSSTAKAFVCVGNLILPWKNDSTQMDIA